MTCDNSETKEVLKIPFRPCKEAVQEMAESLIEVGYIKDKRKNKS